MSYLYDTSQCSRATLSWGSNLASQIPHHPLRSQTSAHGLVFLSLLLTSISPVFLAQFLFFLHINLCLLSFPAVYLDIVSFFIASVHRLSIEV